jgi:hypothetical protein
MTSLRWIAAALAMTAAGIPLNSAKADDNLSESIGGVIPLAGEVDSVADFATGVSRATSSVGGAFQVDKSITLPAPLSPRTSPDWPKDEVIPPPGSE